MLKYLWLSAAVVAVDQVTKWLAVKFLLGRPPLEILPGFDLQLVYNTGAAFGLLDDAGGWQNGFFIAVALVVCVFISNMLRRLQPDEVQGAVALALILGGAIGNLIDRMMFGHVIDFIQMYYPGSSCLIGFSAIQYSGQAVCVWPAFNIADSAIFLGAACLIIDMFKESKNA